MRVFFSQYVSERQANFPVTDQLKIAEFIYHVENQGLDGLTGRNQSSDNVPTNDPNWLNKVHYAQQHKLWHYHIGIPNYQIANNGEQVSEYILHYVKGEDFIRLVKLYSHPPFSLPTLDKLI